MNIHITENISRDKTLQRKVKRLSLHVKDEHIEKYLEKALLQQQAISQRVQMNACMIQRRSILSNMASCVTSQCNYWAISCHSVGSLVQRTMLLMPSHCPPHSTSITHLCQNVDHTNNKETADIKKKVIFSIDAQFSHCCSCDGRFKVSMRLQWDSPPPSLAKLSVIRLELSGCYFNLLQHQS